MKWFLSTRPLAVAMSVLVVAFGYALAKQHLNILILLFVWFVVSATMVTNDYVDRHHDARQGKTFALDQSVKFLWFAVGLWVATAAIIGVITIHNFYSGCLALIIALLGLFYKFSYKTLFLPETIVALEYVLITLFPVLDGGVYDWYSAPVIGLLLLARENVKNVDDAVFDRGYKSTIASWYGTQTAVIVSRCLIAAAVTVGILLSATFKQSIYIANSQIMAMVMIAVAGNWLLSSQFPRARLALDIGAVWFLASSICSIKPTNVTKSAAVVAPVSIQKYGLSTGLPSYKPSVINQPAWMWSFMIALLFVIVTTIRFITGTAVPNRLFVSGSVYDAFLSGTIVVVVFLFFFFNPKLVQSWDEKESKETAGYRLVKRMSSGLLLGIICVTLGANVWVISALMIAISVLAIMFYPKACWHLKQRGFQVGVITALCLFGGVTYALQIFGSAYLATILFYYIYKNSKKVLRKYSRF